MTRNWIKTCCQTCHIVLLLSIWHACWGTRCAMVWTARSIRTRNHYLKSQPMRETKEVNRLQQILTVMVASRRRESSINLERRISKISREWAILFTQQMQIRPRAAKKIAKIKTFWWIFFQLFQWTRISIQILIQHLKTFSRRLNLTKS